jgi:hypothetical protein
MTRKLFLLLLLCFFTFPVVAQASRITLNSATLSTCGNDTLEGYFFISAYDERGVLINNADSLTFTVVFESSNESVAFTVSASSTTPIDFAVSFNQPTTGATLTVGLGSEAASVYEIDCSTLTINALGTAEGRDDRMNFGKGDLLNVIYARTDAIGKPVIHVYSVDGDTGVYAGVFDYALFELYLDTPPTRNTKIGSVDSSTLYALSSGEFQINIGPDAEGKIAVIIFEGLPPKVVRTQLIEVR